MLLLAGFSASAAPPELLIAAASDLAPARDPLLAAFRQATGIPARMVLGASGMFAQQIRHGAPYDVYLSANEAFVSELARDGKLVPGSVRTYAVGRIALWSKDDKVRGLEALADPSIRHVAIPNPAHAPYGVAARQALENRGLWAKIEPKVVYGENVRQALQFAESGNAEAAITAWSLVLDRGGILLPDAWHAPIRQAAGVVAASPHRPEAMRFLEFLTGPEARKLLAKYGLYPPRR